MLCAEERYIKHCDALSKATKRRNIPALEKAIKEYEDEGFPMSKELHDARDKLNMLTCTQGSYRTTCMHSFDGMVQDYVCEPYSVEFLMALQAKMPFVNSRIWYHQI